VGKSDYLQAVHVAAEGLAPGVLARVKITASAPNSLAGELIAR
jgi:tRNA-2-methylthio-N6-dimethylallyladenosine synthase